MKGLEHVFICKMNGPSPGTDSVIIDMERDDATVKVRIKFNFSVTDMTSVGETNQVRSK